VRAIARTSGFTLIEVLVSAALLIVVAAGVAHLTLVAAEACRAARARTATTMMAAQKMEELRALVWARDAGGGLLSDTSTDVSRDPMSSGGTGLGPTPPGTLDRSVAGYVDFADASGRWIGAGPAPPPEATYVRRWAVLPLEADPEHSRLLIVLATTMREERAAEAGGGPRTRRPDDTVLLTVKTRRSSS
jgi:type II secretory pathway pseudopilin PulG